MIPRKEKFEKSETTINTCVSFIKQYWENIRYETLGAFKIS